MKTLLLGSGVPTPGRATPEWFGVFVGMDLELGPVDKAGAAVRAREWMLDRCCPGRRVGGVGELRCVLCVLAIVKVLVPGYT